MLHFRGFDVTWSTFFGTTKWNVKFSSAGLVYAHYGSIIIDNVSKNIVDEEACKRIFERVLIIFLLFRFMKLLF